MRDIDLQLLFEDHAGPDVVYVSHEIVFRQIRINYKIPRVDPDRIRTFRGTPGSGLHHAIRRTVLRAAERARITAYLTTGDMRRDFEQLKQGKLVDEHPRSDAQASEVGAAAAVDPEP